MHMIVEASDEKARNVGEEIIRKADKVAIANMIASAEMDTNLVGSSEGVQISLDKPLEEGNSAFTAIPVIHGSPITVAMKLDEMAEKTGLTDLCSVGTILNRAFAPLARIFYRV